MPEGDSYTRAADRLTPVLWRQVIDAVGGTAPDVRRHADRLTGDTVAGIRTIGKHLLIDVAASGLTIHIHLGMPGRVLISGPTPPRENGRVRMALRTKAGVAAVVAAPTVEVDRRQVIDHSLRRLGPDVLGENFDLDRFRERAERYRGDRTVSDFLLDQRVLAGVGNEYKAEVLFLEGIAPDRAVADLDLDERLALGRRARRLMLPNAHRPIRSTTGRADATAWVYQRGGRPCRRCRTAIRRGWVGEPPRLTFWCPTCQT